MKSAMLNGFLLLTTKGVGSDIYKGDNDTPLHTALKDIIRLVGGIGGLIFTLAVLFIAIVIIFGSISPKNIGRWWIALFSCLGGAILFYSAYFLDDVIASLFTVK